MSDWIDVIDAQALAPGEHMIVDVDGVEVALFNSDGEFLAIEDVCPHDGTELASGEIEAGVITCPRHGARFCLKTGKVLAPPACEDVATFPVRVQAGRIQVRDDRWE